MGLFRNEFDVATGESRQILQVAYQTPEGVRVIDASDAAPEGWVALPDGAPLPDRPKSQQEINAEARDYLALTDWYVIRQQETVEPVPDEILTERAAARARVVE